MVLNSLKAASNSFLIYSSSLYYSLPDDRCLSLFNFYFYFILLYNTVLVLPYIDMNQPQEYMNSQSWITLPPPTPYHLSGSSPCTSPKHPASCFEHRLAICFLHDSIHVSMPFSQIIPPSPSPTESKSPFYTSVSLLLSRIEGYYVGSFGKRHIKPIQRMKCWWHANDTK